MECTMTKRCMALTFWPFPSPTRPTHIAITHVVLTPWPLKWDLDVVVGMREIPTSSVDEIWCLYVTVRWQEIKWSPEECFWRFYAHPGGVCPSADHVSGCIPRHGVLWALCMGAMRKRRLNRINKQILKDYKSISQYVYPQYTLLDV